MGKDSLKGYSLLTNCQIRKGYTRIFASEITSDMVITFQSIYEQAEELSIFEGRRIRDAQGESLYSTIAITEQDKPIVARYAADAAYLLEARVLAIDSVTIGTPSGSTATADNAHDITISFVSDANLLTNVDNETRSVITAYVMWQWLSDKDETRHKAYELIFTTALSALRSSIKRKRPTL